MRISKKILILIATLMISLLFIGCGNESKVQNTDTKGITNGKEIDGLTLLKNKNARKALALAIDKDYITNSILKNGSVSADYLVAKKFAYDLNGEDFRDFDGGRDGYLHYDLDKAKEYWQKAKEELGFDKATLEFLTADTTANKQISEHIQAQWNLLDGLKVDINQQPFKNQLSLRRTGNFQASIGGWGPDFTDGMTFLDMFTNDSPYNEGHWINDEYTKLVNDSKNGDLANLKNTKERTDALRKAEEILINEDTAIIPIYQRGISQLRKADITGLQVKKVSPLYLYKYVDKKTPEEDGKHILKLVEGSDLQSTNILATTDAYSFILLAHTNEGLINLLEENKIDPAMATSWDVSDDGLEYVFHLRDNAYWSNGDKVVAQNFVDSWRMLADPKTGAQYSGMIVTAQIKNGAKIITGDLEPEQLGVEAIDDYTLKVTLEKPVPYFMTLMSRGNFYPINKKFMDECGDRYGTSAEYSISNGPFKLDTWEPGYGYSVVKNENYYDKDKIKLDAITWRVVKETSSHVNLYEKGDIDICNLSGENVEKYEDDKDFVQFLDGAMFYIILNLK